MLPGFKGPALLLPWGFEFFREIRLVLGYIK